MKERMGAERRARAACPRMTLLRLRKRIAGAEKAAMAEIAGNADRGSLYARGLANEGWAGGYLQALRDVQLVMNGVEPNSRYGRAWRG